MRIFTKKAFKFMNRENGSFVKTQPFSFQDVPEWATKDPIFSLAVNEGSIEIIESKQRQKQLENDPNAGTINSEQGSQTGSDEGSNPDEGQEGTNTGAESNDSVTEKKKNPVTGKK